MEDFVSKLKQDVQCSLCNDGLTEPKILSCFHTFCKPCIKRHAELIEEVNVFKCPKCKSETPLPELNSVEDLKSSPLHSRMMKALEFIESEKVCSVSGSHPPASWHCFDCNRSLCDECEKSHSMFTKEHKSTCLNNLKKEDIVLMLRENYCRVHEAKYDFYCNDCGECLCLGCLRSRKCGIHNTTHIQDFISSKRSRLEEAFDHIKTKQEGMQKQLETLKEKTKIVRESGEQAKTEVQETVKRLISWLEESEQELGREIEKIIENAEQNQSKEQVVVDKTQSVLDYICKVMENGDLNEIDAALKDTTGYDNCIDSPNSQESRFKFVCRKEVNTIKISGIGFLKPMLTDPAMSFIQVESENLVPSIPQWRSLCLESQSPRVRSLEARRVEERSDEPSVRPRFVPPRKIVSSFRSSHRQGTSGTQGKNLEALKNSALVVLTKTSSGKLNVDPDDVVDIKISPEDDVKMGMKNVRTDGRIEVQLMAKVAGQLIAEVQVNGNHVSNSPLVMDVKPQKMRISREFQMKGIKTKSDFTGIAINKDNNKIAIADKSAHCVHVFNLGGDLLLTYGSQGNGQGQLDNPHGLAFLNDTDLVIADFGNDRICIVNTDTGTLIKSFGQRGPGIGQFKCPRGVNVDDGNIIVSDYHNHCFQVFSKDGKYLARLTKQSSLDPVSTVTYDGRFYVLDENSCSIHVFEKNQLVKISTIGKKGSADGELNKPRGLAIGNDHHLLVCDRGNKRIQKFALDGRLVGKMDISNPCCIAVLKDGKSLVTAGQRVVLLSK